MSYFFRDREKQIQISKKTPMGGGDMVVKTTGYRGGDAGHGAFTRIEIEDASIFIEVTKTKSGFILNFTGDYEMKTANQMAKMILEAHSLVEVDSEEAIKE